MIRIQNNIAAELYDIIDHCRDDTLESFKQDLLVFLDELDKEIIAEQGNAEALAAFDRIIEHALSHSCSETEEKQIIKDKMIVQKALRRS